MKFPEIFFDMIFQSFYFTFIIEKIAPEVPVQELTKNEITFIAELLMSELFKKKTQKNS